MVQVPEMCDPCYNTLYHILQCLSVHWFPSLRMSFLLTHFASPPWTLSFNCMEITTTFIVWHLVKIKLDDFRKTMHAAAETQYCPLSFKSVVFYLAVRGLFHPSRDIQQYLETILVIITWGGTWLVSAYNPKMLLNILQCTEQPLMKRLFWPKMSISVKVEKPCSKLVLEQMLEQVLNISH